MPPIEDHPLRYKLANELHARPFPSLSAPCRAVFLAIKQPTNAAGRDRSQDLAHLVAFLDRYGVSHPQPGATHYSGPIGQHVLKWEQHTEFVTYTVFMNGSGERAFDPQDFDVFPSDWLDAAPGVRMTSALVTVQERPTDDEIQHALEEWFVPESLAVSRVVDDDAVVAGDFRIDAAGHQRFAVFASSGVGHRRVGRVVQRLCEIETYKSMSMLGFAKTREIGPRLGEIDGLLNDLMAAMSDEGGADDETLRGLLAVSAELENLTARVSFRLGAMKAYEAIVQQRIDVLREERFVGRQTFAEFMMRRYDPAMRTAKSGEQRLFFMSERAVRAADLLRTRVEVRRSAQNQQLLESMDRRAAMQLRLQETVEGLSVVAISYYAVSLAGYVLYPLAGALGISKGALQAVVAVPVVLAVWWMVRRIRDRAQGD